MGIQAWQRRPTAPAVDTPAAAAVAPGSESLATVVDAAPPSTAAARRPEPPAVSGMDWEALQLAVSECRLCELHATRTQTVFGAGARNADWLVIGEAPGKDEDLRGEPFVGRAGQLLNAMLFAVGLQREQVYIANMLKCRPPDNRDPRPAEVGCCEPYLARQIALVQPGVILAVGRIAAQHLLKTDRPIGKLRGIVHHYADTGIPVIATYHPAYLLRSPRDKREAWRDLQLARATLERSRS
jgi:DNA polymerase